MEKTKWAALGISMLLAVSPPAQAQTATTAFQPKEGTNYVIRNMETGMFLRCSDKSLNAAYFSTSPNDYYYLWQFEKPTTGNGWYLKNVGRKGYLNNEATSSTYRGKTDATPSVAWYFSTNTLNPNGYLISSAEITSNTPPHQLPLCL